MSNFTLPATFADILTLVHRSDVVSWSRDGKQLNLTIDDLASDRRAIVDVSFRHLTVDLRILSGFDAKANRWSEYVGGPIRGYLSDRRGEKAVMSWITTQATEVYRCTNTGYFTFYRRVLKQAA